MQKAAQSNGRHRTISCDERADFERIAADRILANRGLSMMGRSSIHAGCYYWQLFGQSRERPDCVFDQLDLGAGNPVMVTKHVSCLIGRQAMTSSG